jgi:hypothetical protein
MVTRYESTAGQLPVTCPYTNRADGKWETVFDSNMSQLLATYCNTHCTV